MVKANEFITESIDAVNELDLYINNNEDLYRKHFMPIVYNLQRKLDKKIYDHEKAKKLWMYLVDTAAREYTQEFGQPGEDVKDFFPKLRNFIKSFLLNDTKSPKVSTSAAFKQLSARTDKSISINLVLSNCLM